MLTEIQYQDLQKINTNHVQLLIDKNFLINKILC